MGVEGVEGVGNGGLLPVSRWRLVSFRSESASVVKVKESVCRRVITVYKRVVSLLSDSVILR